MLLPEFMEKLFNDVIINGLSLSNYNKKTFSEKAVNNLDIQCKLGTVIIENQ